MRRRDFIAALGGAAASSLWPLAARAQQPLPVIGFLRADSPGENSVVVEAFRQGLKQAGYVEGQSVTIEYRWADSQNDRLPALAADLVRRQVNVIFAGGVTAGPLAAKAATSTIPIVFVIGGDPVDLGLVESLGRPGGNVTGVTGLGHGTGTKRMELLHELVPKATRIAALVNPSNPNTPGDLKDLQQAGAAFGVQLSAVNAANDSDFDTAFASIVRQGIEALFVATDTFFATRRARIAGLAAQHAIPAIYGDSLFVEAGGLVSYGVNSADEYRQAGIYAGRILKGERPADLPVLLPTKFDFVLNLRTAKALGLDIPVKLHAFADEVIE
jgi:putative tryptophan/tyrosine transport system substrate-binding protein